MKVKEPSLQKLLEVLIHDDKLKDFTITLDVGDAELEVEDIAIDLEQEIVSISISDRVVCDYAQSFEYDDEEGLLAGDYDE